MDRFRSLPMSQAAVMAGRVVSDLALNLVSLVVMVLMGYLVGFRITTSVGEAVLALLVLMLFAVAFSWVSACIGLAVREPEAAQSAGFVWLFPFTFISNVFVAPATMPPVLRTFAEDINPVSHVANAVRALTVDGYLCGMEVCTNPVPSMVASVAWSVGIIAVFLPLSTWLWRRLG